MSRLALVLFVLLACAVCGAGSAPMRFSRAPEAKLPEEQVKIQVIHPKSQIEFEPVEDPDDAVKQQPVELLQPDPDDAPYEDPEMDPFLNPNSTEYWMLEGVNYVQRRARTLEIPQQCMTRNVVMFLGDGMSLSTLAAARVQQGGEHIPLSFEQFPGTGLAKTYGIDRLVPDSACTATAFLCGLKARFGTIGVDGHVERGSCEAMLDPEHHVDSFAAWAMDVGWSVGLVTSTCVTDATPAGLYAHTSERFWENDARVSESCGNASGVADIAHQLIYSNVGRNLRVVLGGGRSHFLDKRHAPTGKRRDGRNLIAEFLAQESNVYVDTARTLSELTPARAGRVLGLFSDDNLPYRLHEPPTTTTPTLAEMTTKALELLESETDSYGYFLFVEGGNIDKAHHANAARLAIDETLAFADAVNVARTVTRIEDTLIVVTSDHANTMTMAGYDHRGKDVFGPSVCRATDDKPYMKLSYANGPGFARFRDQTSNSRIDPLTVQTGDVDESFPSMVPLAMATHAGSDVPVYASGPWSQIFSGVYEQSSLPHIMAFASGLPLPCSTVPDLSEDSETAHLRPSHWTTDMSDFGIEEDDDVHLPGFVKISEPKPQEDLPSDIPTIKFGKVPTGVASDWASEKPLPGIGHLPNGVPGDMPGDVNPDRTTGIPSDSRSDSSSYTSNEREIQSAMETETEEEKELKEEEELLPYMPDDTMDYLPCNLLTPYSASIPFDCSNPPPDESDVIIEQLDDDLPSDSMNEVPMNLPEDISKELSSSNARDFTSYSAKEDPMDLPQDILKQLSSSYVRDFTSDSAKEDPMDLAQDILKKFSSSNAGVFTSDSAKDVPIDLPEDILKQLSSSDFTSDSAKVDPMKLAQDILKKFSSSIARDFNSDSAKEVPTDLAQDPSSSYARDFPSEMPGDMMPFSPDLPALCATQSKAPSNVASSIPNNVPNYIDMQEPLFTNPTPAVRKRSHWIPTDLAQDPSSSYGRDFPSDMPGDMMPFSPDLPALCATQNKAPSIVASSIPNNVPNYIDMEEALITRPTPAVRKLSHGIPTDLAQDPSSSYGRDFPSDMPGDMMPFSPDLPALCATQNKAPSNVASSIPNNVPNYIAMEEPRFTKSTAAVRKRSHWRS